MISILVIDDDAVGVGMLEAILEEHGHRYTVVADIGSARAQMEKSQFDIVLFDLKMEDGAGPALVPTLKKHCPGAACIAVTGQDELQQAEEILQLGLDGYIVKPFTANIVEIALRNALRLRRLELQEKNLNEKLQREIEIKTQSLNDQLAFLQTLIDSIPIPVYYKDANLSYIGCNKAFEEIIGVSMEDIIGCNAQDIYDSRLADAFSKADVEVIKTGVHDTLECELTDRLGKVHSTIIQKARYLDRNGNIGGIIGVGLDITELKAVERSLRHSEAKIRSIMDNLPVGVVVLDSTLKVLTANRLIKKWFGVDEKNFSLLEEQLVASECEPQFHHNSDAEECIERMMTPHGEKIFRTVLSHLRNEENNIISHVKIFEDITKRLEIERELRQAQKLESIGQLAAGIAHEINTPMQYIGDNLNFLGELFGNLDSLFRKYNDLYREVGGQPAIVETIAEVRRVIDDVDPEYLLGEIPGTISQSLDGVERVNSIVRAMRDFSHPGSEEKVYYDINKALENTLIVSKNEWKYVAVIETVFAPDLPSPLCHPGEINQVFLNIIINAAHAIEASQKQDEWSQAMGKITIVTGLEQDSIIIKITDTGKGIPEDIQNRIFDPFFTTKEVGKGTGQGLAIAHNVIVEKHRGQLLFESRPNQGTAFIVKLPLS